MSKRFRKQSHTIYECKYHLVFCPKYRYRVLTDEVREYARGAIEKLVKQKAELEILELNVRRSSFSGHKTLAAPCIFNFQLIFKLDRAFVTQTRM